MGTFVLRGLLLGILCYLVPGQAEARRGGFLRGLGKAAKTTKRVVKATDKEEEEAQTEEPIPMETPIPTPTPTPVPTPAPTAAVVMATPLPVVKRTPIPNGTVTRVLKVVGVGTFADATGQIRMVGVDLTPFYGGFASECKDQARAELEKLLLNQNIRLYFETPHTDPGSPREAYIFLPDGRCLNHYLIAEGYARVNKDKSFSYKKPFLEAEQKAIAEKRGFWGLQQGSSAIAAPVTAPGIMRRH